MKVLFNILKISFRGKIFYGYIDILKNIYFPFIWESKHN